MSERESERNINGNAQKESKVKLDVILMKLLREKL